MLKYFMAVRNILQTFGIFHHHLSSFGIMYREKSGNPAGDRRRGCPSSVNFGLVCFHRIPLGGALREQSTEILISPSRWMLMGDLGFAFFILATQMPLAICDLPTNGSHRHLRKTTTN
jgi:hypothetical protein